MSNFASSTSFNYLLLIAALLDEYMFIIPVELAKDVVLRPLKPT